MKKLPDKNKARALMAKAIRDGVLKRMPCEVCAEVKSEGHHEDYFKPLEIKWLCKKHHAEVHRKYKIPPKRSIPKESWKKYKTIRIEKNDYLKLKKLAKRRGESLSQVISNLLLIPLN